MSSRDEVVRNVDSGFETHQFSGELLLGNERWYEDFGLDWENHTD